ncbi:V8-like Glu-specific endopeptidase [Saccharothrix tamanrassetensis]|uniref:V8-like Glu-specific endopeptidase n=1 Tax=Saccharothrix tamanrassetensis TaxID=1051531 RepID=A0A841CXJ4_9PSEU|nr:hypothetical protein [Saccharothrix tamanrassetensis]MBB5960707.1 V8-like Glu-specific endopeptidase [Saccharothrix tamanrassetensis]
MAPAAAGAPQAPVEHPFTDGAAIAEQRGLDGSVAVGTPTPPLRAATTAASTRPQTLVQGVLVVDAVGPTEQWQCSASAVVSDNRNMIATAAHCLEDGPKDGKPARRGTGGYFVPAYDKTANADTSMPYGKFAISKMAIPGNWTLSGDVDYDFAFATVLPNEKGRLGDLVGWNGLMFNRGREEARTVVGYLGDLTPYRCDGVTSMVAFPFDVRPSLTHCDVDKGASGSPWLADFDGREGWVNGVSSTQHFFPEPFIASPYFDDDVYDLWKSFRGSN